MQVGEPVTGATTQCGRSMEEAAAGGVSWKAFQKGHLAVMLLTSLLPHDICEDTQKTPDGTALSGEKQPLSVGALSQFAHGSPATPPTAPYTAGN